MSDLKIPWTYFCDREEGRAELVRCSRQFADYLNSLGDLDLVVDDDKLRYDVTLYFGDSWPEPLRHDRALMFSVTRLVSACYAERGVRSVLEWTPECIEKIRDIDVRSVDCFHFEEDSSLDAYNSYLSLRGDNMKERLTKYLGCLRKVALLMGQVQELAYEAEKAINNEVLDA